MTIVSLVFALVVVGVALWLINEFIPMDARIKKIINVLVIVFVCFWLLQRMGLMLSLGQYRIGP